MRSAAILAFSAALSRFSGGGSLRQDSFTRSTDRDRLRHFVARPIAAEPRHRWSATRAAYRGMIGVPAAADLTTEPEGDRETTSCCRWLASLRDILMRAGVRARRSVALGFALLALRLPRAPPTVALSCRRGSRGCRSSCQRAGSLQLARLAAVRFRHDRQRGPPTGTGRKSKPVARLRESRPYGLVLANDSQLGQKGTLCAMGEFCCAVCDASLSDLAHGNSTAGSSRAASVPG